MKSSHRDPSINIIIDRYTFQNNQITLYPYFTFLSEQVWEYLKHNCFFYYEVFLMS